MHTFYFGKVNIMPKKYTPEVKAKAVRPVRDHVDDYASEWDAIKTVANRLGMGAETLRKWVRPLCQRRVAVLGSTKVSPNTVLLTRSLGTQLPFQCEHDSSQERSMPEPCTGSACQPSAL